MIRIQSTPALDTPLELTPLIDIVFIIVVFLLITAHIQLLSLPVEIPSSDGLAEATTAATLLITLKRDKPHWAINDQLFEDWQVFKPTLLSKLTEVKQHQDPLIHIAPERNAEVEQLVKLLSLLNQEQIANTQILVEEQHDQ